MQLFKEVSGERKDFELYTQKVEQSMFYGPNGTLLDTIFPETSQNGRIIVTDWDTFFFTKIWSNKEKFHKLYE